MSTLAVSCTVKLRGFDSNAVDETPREIFCDLSVHGESFSVNITEPFMELTGADRFHNGFPNVVSSTPLNEVLVDIDPKTKKFKQINQSSVVDWVFQVYNKTDGQMHSCTNKY